MMQNYLVHNASRDRHNRTLRATQPVHGGHKQVVMGDRRLLRNRPIVVSEEELKAHLHELQDKEKLGLVKVTTPNFQPVNLATLEVGEIAAASPPVNKRLDSAANDRPGGQTHFGLPGEKPPPAEFTMPVAPPQAAVDQPLIPEPVEEVNDQPLPELSGHRLAGPLAGEGTPVTVTPSHERPSFNKKKGGR